MSESPKLGKLVEGEAGRDAIHIAIAPVIAATELKPGQHIGLNPDGQACDIKPYIGIVDPFLTTWIERGQQFYICLYPGTITSLRHEWIHPAFGPVPSQLSKVPPWTIVPTDWRTWNGGTAPKMIKSIREYNHWGDLPILADALEEGGFKDALLLADLRKKLNPRHNRIAGQRLLALVEGGALADSIRWLDLWASQLGQSYEELITAANKWVEVGHYTYDNSEKYKEVDYEQWPIFWEHYAQITGTNIAGENKLDHFFTCSC